MTMLTDEEISKTLSFWLRHRPDAANMALNDAGWGEVDAVLAAFARSEHEVTWDRLLQVVEANDKQRFEFSPDACLIRARQGHSIPVQGDWPKSSPPELLYHGTVERFLPLIMSQGLKPMARHHVHLSSDAETAGKVGARRGPPVILTIHAARLASTGHVFFLTDNHVWLTAHVPPEFIGTG
jgi:putative RNA 2'-phosphotransferase